MKKVTQAVILAFASCFFLTYPVVRWSKKRRLRWTGAGLIGTLAGVATASWIPLTFLRGALVLLGGLFVSVVVSDRAEAMMGTKDDQRIVIDEWIGYWASIVCLPQTPLVLVSAFILFRIVDTLKPLGVNSLARLPGGWGVVMDDFVGGLLVNICLRGMQYLL